MPEGYGRRWDGARSAAKLGAQQPKEHPMSDLIALIVVAFPLIVLFTLIVQIIRNGDGILGDLPPDDMLYRVSDALIGHAV
jgi:hypothetical protein